MADTIHYKLSKNTLKLEIECIRKYKKDIGNREQGIGMEGIGMEGIGMEGIGPKKSIQIFVPEKSRNICTEYFSIYQDKSLEVLPLLDFSHSSALGQNYFTNSLLST